MAQTPEQVLQWKKNLQRFLYNDLLPMAEPDPQLRLELVKPEPMKIWTVAFTHKSFNPNIGENYEILEKLGDGVMKTTFTDYLTKRFTNLDEGTLTLFQNSILTKVEQANLANQYNLPKYLRTAFESSIHTSEDVLEAYFGALLSIGNSIRMGQGYTYAYNTIVNIFNKIDFSTENLAINLKDPITYVKELFEQEGWGKGTPPFQFVKKDPSKESGVYMIKYTPQAISDLRGRGLRVVNDVVAQAPGNTQQAAQVRASTEAVKVLNSMGFRLIPKDKKDPFRHRDLAPYYPGALAKARSEGFVALKLQKSKGSTGCYSQLLGEREDGYLEVLVTVTGCDEQEANRNALRTYSSE